MKNLFISESYVKENLVNGNVEPKFIRVAVQNAQEINLVEAIGSQMVKKIDSLLPTDINLPINVNYKLLLDDYIAPVLLRWSVMRCIPNVRYKITNKGFNIDSSDNSAPVEFVEYKHQLDILKNDADFLEQQLKKHLEFNTNKYPEYYQGSKDDVLPSQTPYFCGVYIPDEEPYNDACYRNFIIRRK